ADNGNNWFKVFPWVTYNNLRFISFDNNNNPIFSGDNGTLFHCENKDSIPIIDNFNISPSLSGNYFKPIVKVHDFEQNHNLIYSITILNELHTSSDQSFKTQIVHVNKNEHFINYPSDIFVEGDSCTFRLTIFD